MSNGRESIFNGFNGVDGTFTQFVNCIITNYHDFHPGTDVFTGYYANCLFFNNAWNDANTPYVPNAGSGQYPTNCVGGPGIDPKVKNLQRDLGPLDYSLLDPTSDAIDAGLSENGFPYSLDDLCGWYFLSFSEPS